MKDKAYPLHPSYLSLELGLAVDTGDFKFLYEDRKTKQGLSSGIWGL